MILRNNIKPYKTGKVNIKNCKRQISWNLTIFFSQRKIIITLVCKKMFAVMHLTSIERELNSDKMFIIGLFAQLRGKTNPKQVSDQDLCQNENSTKLLILIFNVSLFFNVNDKLCIVW